MASSYKLSIQTKLQYSFVKTLNQIDEDCIKISKPFITGLSFLCFINCQL